MSCKKKKQWHKYFLDQKCFQKYQLTANVKIWSLTNNVETTRFDKKLQKYINGNMIITTCLFLIPVSPSLTTKAASWWSATKTFEARMLPWGTLFSSKYHRARESDMQASTKSTSLMEDSLAGKRQNKSEKNINKRAYLRTVFVTFQVQIQGTPLVEFRDQGHGVGRRSQGRAEDFDERAIFPRGGVVGQVDKVGHHAGGELGVELLDGNNLLLSQLLPVSVPGPNSLGNGREFAWGKKQEELLAETFIGREQIWFTVKLHVFEFSQLGERDNVFVAARARATDVDAKRFWLQLGLGPADQEGRSLVILGRVEAILDGDRAFGALKKRGRFRHTGRRSNCKTSSFRGINNDTHFQIRDKFFQRRPYDRRPTHGQVDFELVVLGEDVDQLWLFWCHRRGMLLNWRPASHLRRGWGRSGSRLEVIEVQQVELVAALTEKVGARTVALGLMQEFVLDEF